MKFPKVGKVTSIQERYLGKIDKNMLDIMKKMFALDPKERIGSFDALRHPYFSEINAPYLRSYSAK